ncbi:LLM class flavin-dependent oxidoreductase [Microlunatus panaciterrae]|uniref:Alkanesulfonate monooxygenase SsuD/methylene tetrahydromethanopterin reductase-like flavin-dependent oxidoreductase (Luciferase family) n=1 Tax=Microlunatus panaciterrae TaxID=400768 RepID=A0ABS2RHH7_9ACTN|nr:LLM class flavin-dependent oxidoreductase [Microlunatus panaciterrae]MBM7798459.1 alkanesulfonate monooxygenase SsuD/methylene tetrahydromethanopterin reductase-like flavin-dependent oxidoreductase (luciferase family) [Microlunatus panaciterrae]
MAPTGIQVGMCFDRTFPAPLVTEFAVRLEEGGADQLWVIEDCFFTAGISLAAAALTATRRLTVGIGILPAVSRTAAVTAMEIATLCQLAPGRVLPGIGHGVQAWMAQMGVRPSSPLTALDEVMTAVGRLLDGETVTVDGDYVQLDNVALHTPPTQRPPLLAGVQSPRSLALAGRCADGVVLIEPCSPSYVRSALAQAGNPEPFHVAAFGMIRIMEDRRDAYRSIAPWLASQLQLPNAALRALPFFDDLVARHARDGVDGLASMPVDWWTEIGPIGTLDDAARHLDALEAAGVHSVGFYPAADVATARTQVDDVLRLAAR